MAGRWDTMVEHKPNISVGGPWSIFTSVMPRHDSEYGALSQLSMPFLILDKETPEVVKGPKGDKGDKGDTGLRGPAGIGLKGDKGDSVKGDKGDSVKGDPGYTPRKGVDYFDGRDGDKGDPGHTPVKGVDYFDGERGPEGKRGPRGERGHAGKDADIELIRYLVDTLTYWNTKEVTLGIAATYRDNPTGGKIFLDRLMEAYRISQGKEADAKTMKSYVDCITDAAGMYDPKHPEKARDYLAKRLGELGLSDADNTAKYVMDGLGKNYSAKKRRSSALL